MNQEVKAKWVAALRSGEYQQTTGRLCRVQPDGSKGYCCLGVLSDVAVREGLEIEVTGNGSVGLGFGDLAFDGEQGLLPGKVAEWAGLPTDVEDGAVDVLVPRYDNSGAPLVNSEGMTVLTALSEMNDIGFTFEEIADLIEARL